MASTRTAVIRAGRGCLAAAVVCLLMAAGPTPHPHSPSGGTTRISGLTSTKVVRFAESEFPDAYAEIAVTDERTSLVVYRMPTRGFDESLRKRFPTVPMIFIDTTVSAKQMNALTERIAGDFPYWQDRGIRLVRVGPDPVKSGVKVVTTNTHLRHVTKLLEARYGKGRLYVVHGQQATVSLPTRTASP